MSRSRTHTVEATVDSIDGTMAVLDANGVALRVPIAWLPDGLHEGDGVAISFAPRDASALADSVTARLAKLTKG